MATSAPSFAASKTSSNISQYVPANSVFLQLLTSPSLFSGDVAMAYFDAKGDRNAAAVDAYKMEVETAALIRAAEDILSLTRTMKEMWLFGKLETVGTNEAEERADESARGVEEGLTRLMAAEKKK
ncbi:MAG: hypothetical protein Q9205_002403 [Flavoplaca limonia]